MSTDRIEQEVFIDAPRERVWSILTDAGHLGTWFGDAGAEIDLRPNGALALHWTEHGTVRGRVERVEPHGLFSFRWADGDTEPRDGNSTLVEFTLAAEGAGTRLRVVESGFSELEGPREQWVRKLEDNREGWEIKLRHLVDHTSRAMT